MEEEMVVKIQEKNLVRKTPRYFPYLVTFCTLVLLGLFVDRIFLFQKPYEISKFTAQLELVAHFFILVLSLKVYKNVAKNIRKIILWLALVNVGTSLVDFYEYSIKYFNNDNMPHVLNALVNKSLLEFIFFWGWIIPILVFLFNILQIYKLRIKTTLKILFVFGVIDFIVILLFLSSVHYAEEVLSLATIIQIISFIAVVIVFDFVILCLICAENMGLILFLLGIIGLISGYFFAIYDVLSQIYVAAYGEIIWFLGLLLNLFGVLIIGCGSNSKIINLARKYNSIKSKLVLWCFGMAIIGFLLFFIMAYAFALISRTVFLGLPLFIMIYSAIIISASLYIGEYFEEPFKKIENNIKMLMLKDKPTDMNEDFSIEEFIFLQKFIVEAFKNQEETEHAKLGELTAQKEAERLRLENEATQAVVGEQEKFRTIVKQTLHDIQSPLSSLGTIVEEHNINMPENTRVTLRNAADRIGDIANNLLNQYGNKSQIESESSALLVSLALLQIMSEKRYEYNDSPVKFVTEFKKLANFAFIKINPADFKRMISNLINNAVQAIKDKPDGKVSIELSTTSENVIISLEDNGYGMPEHIKEKFFQRVEVTEGKENGHGIGLTQIYDTIYNNGGKCNIYVTEGERTRFVIKYPIASTSHWIATEIKLYLDDTVVVLDDDESIHGAWDAKFKDILAEFPTLTVKHFTYGKDVIDYINGLDEAAKQSTMLLTDYELLNQGMNGLDVVRETNMKRAILVTSYSANAKVQELVMQAGIKLLPKELTSIVAISVDKKLEKWSKKVDVVWVEDQKWFVDDLVRDYYNHLKVDLYYEPDTFMAEVHQYPLDTRIILDTYYIAPDGTSYLLDGFTIAHMLHEMGYTKLILFSGETVEQAHIPPYLTVILKNDLVNKKQLDKV